MIARLPVMAVVLGAALLAAGCAETAPEARHTHTPTLAHIAMEAAKGCIKPSNASASAGATPAPSPTYYGLDVADLGHTVTINTRDADHIGDGMDIYNAGCLMRGMKVPESVISRMSKTRAMDGQVTDSWDDKKVTWSYQPLDGLFVTISEGGPALTSD